VRVLIGVSVSEQTHTTTHTHPYRETRNSWTSYHQFSRGNSNGGLVPAVQRPVLHSRLMKLVQENMKLVQALGQVSINTWAYFGASLE
jgi:hypothetical protein